MEAKLKTASVVIVGGGIAGLSAAWHLARSGMVGVVLLESEPMLASHSSARNAAIYMCLEDSAASCVLAQRSRVLLDQYLGTGWLDAVGLVHLAKNPKVLDALYERAERFGTLTSDWRPTELRARLPILEDAHTYGALAVPLSGVMDVAKVVDWLGRKARAAGAKLYTRAEVASLEIAGGAVQACVLSDESRIETPRVVIANGAWAQELGARAGYPLPLVPLRRHLVLVEGEGLHVPRMPVIWDMDRDLYLRPESGGILASPCDETPWRPELPSTDEAQIELLAQKLTEFSSHFSSARVRRAWACLRTMAPDREAVIGADPRVTGLYWSAGLGGRGMTVGPASGEVLARTLMGASHPLAGPLSPARLL